ncbi:MAG TPA: cell division topological specificity factor MinE [Syntrophaceticus sp.]|uniref:cell division topological specificity factor MinE n=1 Tax=Syntrophaceticus schinkii TaxID=499207 RepID=UPI0005CC3A48|nr:cell division topological specificity factor MinE [Syntrophaceticus schinkii]MDD2361100.1 cell division topological specificity factor MinE [Syntrophaceticus schinkii]MDD4262038.1 cell division topological specificity factor MinE [Syntrophaceticus schinkii]MDD4675823.1 cell division topological specificity factor MinE [Syntrophaceticus schinkii]HHY29585.1 cell division topological specificity factor MinE [Syntrophaceticus sp.]
MLELLQRIFGRDSLKSSKNVAQERLRLVLMHDRLDLSPQVLEELRSDLMNVIKDYMEIDEDQMEINLEQDKKCVALVANIPVLRMKRLPSH